MTLERAREFLSGSEASLALALPNASATLSYYSMFHAAIRALEAAGIRAEKWSHEGLQAAFSRELIQRRKLYPAKLSSYLPEAMAVRLKADYRPEGVGQRIAARLYEKAREFLNHVEEVTR